jgi:hypothetical protein
MNYYSYTCQLAGYPAIFSIRYPPGYPASQMRIPGIKKAGSSGRISVASLLVGSQSPLGPMYGQFEYEFKLDVKYVVFYRLFN